MNQRVKETDSHVILQVMDGDKVAYEVGYPKSDGYSADTLLSNISETDQPRKADAAFAKLNWVPGKEGYTSPQAERIGISQGYVSHDRGPIYEYRINFHNTKGWHFEFKDESGDVYGCKTIFNGWHYIDYNSEQPIIIGVR